MIWWTPITVLSNYFWKADTLSCFLVTTSSNSKIRVAATTLAPVRPKIPVTLLTGLTLLPPYSWLTDTLARLLVALGILATFAAVAGNTASQAASWTTISLHVPRGGAITIARSITTITTTILSAST